MRWDDANNFKARSFMVQWREENGEEWWRIHLCALVHG